MLKKENIIITDSVFKSKKDLFKFIAEKAFELKISNDKKELVKGFIERESLGSTGFNEGFGIPHCKSSSVTKPSVIFIRANNPIKWDSLDGNPLTELFALLVPEDEAKEHLEILVQISRQLMKDDFRKLIKDQKDQDSLFKVLKNI